jgi:hypothetical protein
MKKKYNLRPCMTVVKMRNHQLLAGSVEGEGSDYEWGD